MCVFSFKNVVVQQKFHFQTVSESRTGGLSVTDRHTNGNSIFFVCNIEYLEQQWSPDVGPELSNMKCQKK